VYFINNNMRWHDKEGRLEFSHVQGLVHTLDSRNSFVYQAGFFYEDEPLPYIKSYRLSTSYRRELHKNWLYSDITPSVTWMSEDQFRGLAALSISLEAYFY